MLRYKKTIVVLVLISLFILTYIIACLTGKHQLNLSYEALKANGFPITIDEIIPKPVDDAENAALIYNAVAKKLEIGDGVHVDIYKQINELSSNLVYKEITEEELTKLKELYQTQIVKDAIIEITKAANMAKYRQNLDYSKGIEIDLSHLSHLRKLSKLISSAAIIEAQAGNSDTAWQYLETGIKMGLHGRDEPILISQMVRIAQIKIALDGIHNVAKLCPPSAEQQSKIDKLLLALDEIDSCILTLNSERILLSEAISNLSKSKLDEMFHPNKLGSIYRRIYPVFIRDCAHFNQVMNQLTNEAKKTEISVENFSSDKFLKDVPSYCLITSEFIKAYPDIRLHYASLQAALRLTRIGFALIDFKQKNGKFPDNLEALGEIGKLQDPFNSKGFIYKNTPKQTIIYSIGRNLRDDNGVQNDGDISWVLEEEKK